MNPNNLHAQTHGLSYRSTESLISFVFNLPKCTNLHENKHEHEDKVLERKTNINTTNT